MQNIFHMIQGEVGGLPKMMDDDDGLRGCGNRMFMNAYDPNLEFGLAF